LLVLGAAGAPVRRVGAFDSCSLLRSRKLCR